jgi:hypothetical protein
MAQAHTELASPRVARKPDGRQLCLLPCPTRRRRHRLEHLTVPARLVLPAASGRRSDRRGGLYGVAGTEPIGSCAATSCRVVGTALMARGRSRAARGRARVEGWSSVRTLSLRRANPCRAVGRVAADRTVPQSSLDGAGLARRPPRIGMTSPGSERLRVKSAAGRIPPAPLHAGAAAAT